MKIALASPPFPKSIVHGLELLESLSLNAASQGSEIICFPESFLPGYPGMGYPKNDRTDKVLKKALTNAKAIAKENNIALILPMDSYVNDQIYNVAFVIDKNGHC